MVIHKREDYLFTRISRKTYIPIYLIVLLIIGSIIFFWYNGFEINKYAIIGALAAVLICIKSTEIHRLNHKYEITSNSLVHTRGIFGRVSRRLDFFAISDFDVSQTLWQRILNYGNVNVRLFSKDSTSCVKNIDRPFEFMKFLEDQIIKVRRNALKQNEREATV